MTKQARGKISTAQAGRSPAQIRREFQRRSAEEPGVTISQLDKSVFRMGENGTVGLVRQPSLRSVVDQMGGTVAGRFLRPVMEIDTSSTPSFIGLQVAALKDNISTLAKMHNEMLATLKAKGLLER